MATLIRFYRAMTPVHAGASFGNSMVDMPVQKEIGTSIPKVESSTLKGAYREQLGDLSDVNTLMGKPNQAGLLGFGDLKLFAFPINCSQKTFVYLTSPMLIEQVSIELNYMRDNNKYAVFNDLLKLLKYSKNELQDDEVLVFSKFDDYIYLDAYCYEARCAGENMFESEFLRSIQEQLVLIDDRSMHTILELYTELRPRIAINNDTGTTVDSSLFDVEYVPEGTIFYGLIHKFEQEIFSKNSVRKENDNYKVQGEEEIWSNWKKSTGKNTVLTVGGFTSLGKGAIVVMEEVDNEN